MLYKYTIADVYQYDPTIFDYLEVPEQFDKETVVEIICRNCGYFSLIRRFGDLPYLKRQIGFWSKENQKKWDKIGEAYDLEYNIGWNVDGVEQEVYSGKTTGSTDGLTKVSTYEDDTLHTDNSSENDSVGTQDYTRTFTKGGNIGLTTTGDLIRDALDTWKEVNFYQEISKDFAKTFCIRIY